MEQLTSCVRNGTRLGWFVDPQKKRVTVFRPGRAPETLTEGSLNAAPVLPGVVFPLREVFGWLVRPR
jgi:Uma2 family endonuclease